MIFVSGKYWLYYKGEQMGMSGWESKWGVALGEDPEGPYVKSDLNPVTRPFGHVVRMGQDDLGLAGIANPWDFIIRWDRDDRKLT